MRLSDKQADRLFDSILNKLEKKLERKILTNFRNLSLLIRDIIEGGGEFSGNVIIIENQQSLEADLREAYFEAINEGIKFTYRDLGESEPEEEDFNAIILLLLPWVTNTSEQHAQYLTKTTTKIFNETYKEISATSQISRGSEEARQVSVETSRQMEVKNKKRAKVIATTEANMAFQTAAIKTAEKLERRLLKRWVSQNDKRVRDSHVRAHKRYLREPIPLEQDFMVGAGSGSRPLDPRLPSEETIACRCYMRFVNEIQVDN